MTFCIRFPLTHLSPPSKKGNLSHHLCYTVLHILEALKTLNDRFLTPLSLPTQDVCFILKSQQLEKLKKASYVYSLPDISAIGEDGVVKLVARDKKNDTSNDFSIVVGETDKKFTFNFKEEKIYVV